MALEFRHRDAPHSTSARGRVTARLRHLQFQLAPLWGVSLSVARHPAARLLLLIVLMTIQLALCLLAMYLIDLGISLMELWAELARKHLELTL